MKKYWPFQSFSKISDNLVLACVIVAILSSWRCQSNDDELISIIVEEVVTDPVQHGLNHLSATLQSLHLPFEIVHSETEVSGHNILKLQLATGTWGQSESDLNDQMPNEPEAYSISRIKVQDKSGWLATGFDERGLMYALFDIADCIEYREDESAPLTGLKTVHDHPYVGTRAISMYTMNRRYWETRFYDEAYWKKYMDMLARSRFNSVVLIFGYENGGFLAPCYPYFFNVDEYPGVGMPNMAPEEQARNLAALNRMIEIAHNRGIEFKVGIWDHIYRGGVQAGGISPEDLANQNTDHLVEGLNAENLSGYTKVAFAKFVQLVPELDGFQLRMHNESGLERGQEMANFWSEMFGMIKEVAPDMQIDLRAKELPESIIEVAIQNELNFTITTKYWMEQMGLPFHPTHINRENQHDRRHGYADMLKYPRTYDIHWRLWSGGTQRILLWGDPNYVRRFAKSTHLYNGKGFEINEPLATKMEAQPHTANPFSLLNPNYIYYQYEFERFWYFYQVFGRLSYNPKLSSELWENAFAKRVGKDAAPLVQKALHKASQILPRIIAACSPYGKFPTTRGWAEKQRYGDLHQYADAEGSDIQQFASFDTEAKLLIDKGVTAKRLPSITSHWFLFAYNEVKGYIEKIHALNPTPQNKELTSTITDLNILAYLALYHSQRIPAAVSYRLYQRTKDPHALDDAIRYEQMAIGAWRKIISSAGDHYASDLMMGVRQINRRGLKHGLSGHWKNELNYLREDVEKLIVERAALGKAPKQRQSPSYVSYSDKSSRPEFEIMHQPIDSATINQHLKISVTVQSPNDIEWVHLRHRPVNQHLDYATLSMQRQAGSNMFNATILASDIDHTYDFMYFFEVMDKNGNGQIYPDLDIETPYIVVKFQRN
ncbi:MAG: hypothetical protein HKN87_24455 [Saprospiraceae bacterium]|nr:hypothetical protein [Saprospiraceae bacterium]